MVACTPRSGPRPHRPDRGPAHPRPPLGPGCSPARRRMGSERPLRRAAHGRRRRTRRMRRRAARPDGPSDRTPPSRSGTGAAPAGRNRHGGVPVLSINPRRGGPTDPRSTPATGRPRPGEAAKGRLGRRDGVRPPGHYRFRSTPTPATGSQSPSTEPPPGPSPVRVRSLPIHRLPVPRQTRSSRAVAPVGSALTGSQSAPAVSPPSAESRRACPNRRPTSGRVPGPGLGALVRPSCGAGWWRAPARGPGGTSRCRRR
jgi:hypothetical protein